MKIVLNRKEMKAFREFVNTMESIEGVPMSTFKDNINVSTKAYIASLITGELTVEINEDCVTELLNITNDMFSELAPVIRAIHALGNSMAPTLMKYETKFGDWHNRYAEPVATTTPNWELTNVTTETITEEQFNKEAV